MAEQHLTPEVGALIEAAKGAAGHAYAPYSGFRVGAAVRGGSGRLYVGCNVENSSFPVGLCAERNAVGSALAAGEGKLEAIAVAPGDDRLDTLVPCGMCRQFLSEFGELAVISKQEGNWLVQPLSAFLPMAFRLEPPT